VSAIDTDADAVACARENGARNGVRVNWQVADVAAYPPGQCDVVLANLTGAWLRRLSAALLAKPGSGGTLVLSGLQTSERERVLEVFSGSTRLEAELDEEGWSALVLVKAQP
jgi:ribosomal protein L11 methylase PrmA